VAGVPSEFDDVFDEDERGRLLPPEDRIWRHPSELANPVAAEVRAARERWIASTPSRAGAWSAGLVGAVLATGVVLVGMHMTSWLGDNSHRPYRIAEPIVMSSTTLASQSPAVSSVVAPGLMFITVSRSQGEKGFGDGVLIGNVGSPARRMILVPAGLVSGASSIEVTTYDRQVFAGQYVGSDPGTGLAVVSILDSDSLHVLAYSPSYAMQPGSWIAVEWATPTDALLSIGAVRSFGQVASGDGAYKFALSVNLQMPNLSSAPSGTALVNGEGQLLGIITHRKGDRVTEVPASLAELVGMDIAENGKFVHGWLGISARSASADMRVSGQPLEPAQVPAGVEVVSVQHDSSGAVAGLKPGDVIEAVNGRPVRSMQDLGADLLVLPPKTAVQLTIDSGATIRTVKATLQPAA
jgi:S1-C subfamily serine protease